MPSSQHLGACPPVARLSAVSITALYFVSFWSVQLSCLAAQLCEGSIESTLLASSLAGHSLRGLVLVQHVFVPAFAAAVKRQHLDHPPRHGHGRRQGDHHPRPQPEDLGDQPHPHHPVPPLAPSPFEGPQPFPGPVTTLHVGQLTQTVTGLSQLANGVPVSEAEPILNRNVWIRRLAFVEFPENSQGPRVDGHDFIQIGPYSQLLPIYRVRLNQQPQAEVTGAATPVATQGNGAAPMAQ